MKTRLLLFFCCYIICIDVSGQDSLMQKELDEVIIYSSKFAERKKNIVQKIDVVSAYRIAQINAQNTGDLLVNTGNVFVQKSQQGGSSPVLRGFEASRILLVVDGVRMNNAIYRSGHLQNAITIDQNVLESMEVLYGPASTLYGSDALGGAVHFRTKIPRLSLTEKPFLTGSGFIRYSTANKEKTAHFDISIGGKKFGWLQSYNYSSFSDLKMGANDPKDYPLFWVRPSFIKHINGVDTIVKNSDERLQKFSGYKQWDVTQKFLFKQSDKVSHLLNLQYSNSSEIPRYDRLQDSKNGSLRYAEWYYGPQLRQLAAYELNVRSLGFADDMKAIISYQKIKERRHQREYKRYDRQDNRYEDLNVLAINLDARKLWTNNELTFGTDAQLNALMSLGMRKNILTGAVSKLDSRYPNGENNMNLFGIYAQHLMKFGNGKFVLNDGIRLQTSHLRSTIADNSFFNFPFTSIEQNNTAVTGNAGLIYMPSVATRFSAGFSTAFRSPNIDDLSRIFESNTASGQLIIPNPGIKPEYTYTFDLGIQQSIKEIVKLEAGVFYTIFNDAIGLAPFQLNGKDSVLYNNAMVKVFANQNVNNGFLYGFNGSATINFSSALKLFSTLNYTYGRLQPSKSQQIPLDHIPPVFGKTSFTYSGSKIYTEVYALYNGWKHFKDYNPAGEDNLQYATPQGIPAWCTMNLKSTIRMHKNISLQFGVENIFDRNYRYFASGFSAPGRNFIFAVRSNF